MRSTSSRTRTWQALVLLASAGAIGCSRSSPERDQRDAEVYLGSVRNTAALAVFASREAQVCDAAAQLLALAGARGGLTTADQDAVLDEIQSIAATLADKCKTGPPKLLELKPELDKLKAAAEKLYGDPLTSPYTT